MKNENGDVLKMEITFAITLIVEEQKNGYYIVTCEELPEFLTGGETFEEVKENVLDAFISTLEIYHHSKRELPEGIIVKGIELSKPRFATITPKRPVDNDLDDFWFTANLPSPPNFAVPTPAYA